MAEASGETNGTGSQGPTPTPPPPGGRSAVQRVFDKMNASRVEAALWCTRMFTVISTILFLLPLLGGNPFSFYQRALISNAATSALRLHQRLPQFQFSRQFMGQVFLEDSAHYLFFSIIFLNCYPITMGLVPVFLFALLHASTFTRTLLDQVGPNAGAIIRNLLNKLQLQQTNILRFIAVNEIFLMPAIVFMIFTGKASILLPFVYYRFLTLRYSSRRNPYCKQLFYELRVTIEHFVNKPQCPQAVRNIVFKAIAMINRLAPATIPAAS